LFKSDIIPTGPWLDYFQKGDILEDVYFSLPITKAKVALPSDEKALCWIEGIASTEDVDLQNEVVLQGGIDTRYFLKHGYFNNDHKPGFENKVGEPTEAKIITKEDGGLGLHVKGFLYRNHKVADSIRELAMAQESTPGSRRTVGFSIQGKVLKRDGKKIVRCWLQDVAVTPSPINPNTFLDIVKSFDSCGWTCDVEKSNCCWDCGMKKALDLDCESDDKALGAATASSVLAPESLEGEDRKKVFERIRKNDEKITKAEAIKLIQMHKGYSRSMSELLVDLSFRMVAEEQVRSHTFN